MKLKRHIIIALLGAVALGASAQGNGDRFRYGPSAGVNITDSHFKQTIVGTSTTVNPTAGLQCEFIFTSFGLGIDFGVGYSAIGAKINLGQKPIWALQGYGDERVMIHNLQLPLHLRFKWTKMQGVEDYVAPFIYGGPEFNIQLAHSRHKADGQKAFRFSGGDIALGCGFGLELFKRVQVSGGYTWHMTYDLKTTLLEDYSARMRGWNVRVAYMF